MANPSSNEDAIATLNDLIETARDSADGFHAASEGVKDGYLRVLFGSYARQREQFVAELQLEVRNLGGEPEKNGSVAASIHRSWIDIKSAALAGDEPAVIAEAERGEDQAVKSYREALGADLPPQTRAVLERQFRVVQEAHRRIRGLVQQRRAA